VIILSADATPGQISRLLAAGARAYLTKPLDVQELLAKVDACCAGQESEPRPRGRTSPPGCNGSGPPCRVPCAGWVSRYGFRPILGRGGRASPLHLFIGGEMGEP